MKHKFKKLFFRNKVSLPRETFGQGREIIEEYDETTETEWRRKHTESLRKHKEKERHERLEHATHKKEDINTFFDELEMMEELAEELETMEIQDDDTLKRILSGELKVPENKKRVALVQSSKKIAEEEYLPIEINNNDLITQNNQEIVDLLRNYRNKIKEVLRNVKKDDERNVNLFLDLIELKDDIEDDIRRMNDDEILESDEDDSDDETTSVELKPAEDGKRVRFSALLEDVKLIESKSEFFDAPQTDANTIQINFQHSDVEFNHKASDADVITHPGEIYAKFHKPQKVHVPAKKSILKNKEKEVKYCETKDEKKVKKIFESDVQVIGEVKEHEKKEISQSIEELVHVSAKNENPKKMSKFKQMRMKS